MLKKIQFLSQLNRQQTNVVSKGKKDVESVDNLLFFRKNIEKKIILSLDTKKTEPLSWLSQICSNQIKVFLPIGLVFGENFCQILCILKDPKR